MKSVLFPLLIPLLLIPFRSNAQEEGMARKGLLRTQGGFSYGSLLKGGGNVYLDGTLAYYFDTTFSVRGDSFFLLPEASEGPFQENMSIFSGFVYHFRNKVNFDPYIGFQPGLALSRRKVEDLPLPKPEKDERSLNPLVSGVVGVHYYGPAVFHLLLECRYVHGRHLSKYYGPLSLNEFRFVFGLGLNLNVLDPYWKE